MRVYQSKSEQPLKWLFAAVLFCLVLGWAMSDVYGTENDPNQNDNSKSSSENQVYPPPQEAPSAVPEPTTLALLALGLGGAVAYRKLKK